MVLCYVDDVLAISNTPMRTMNGIRNVFKLKDDKAEVTLWWDAIMKEIKNVRPAFEVFEKRKEDIPIGYQHIKCHMIFDVKLGENFRRKERLVGGGHTANAPASITYS